MSELIPIQDAAKMLGVTQTTLRRWDTEGKLKAIRVGDRGHRKYRVEDLGLYLNLAQPSEKISNSTKDRVAVYCRVSSHDQKKKGDLDRQVCRVLEYCVKHSFKVVEVVQEVGSGMNDKRPKLHKLMSLIENGKVDIVVVEHKDRLIRFNYNIIDRYFSSHGVSIECVETVMKKSFEDELVEDMLSLMASFSAKIYGKRSAKNRKAKVAKK